MYHFSRSTSNSFWQSPALPEDCSSWNDRDTSHTLSSYNHPTSTSNTNHSTVSYSYDTLRLPSFSHRSLISTANSSWSERDERSYSAAINSSNSFWQSPALPKGCSSGNERDANHFSSTFNSRTVSPSSVFNQTSSASTTFRNSSYRSYNQSIANPHESFLNCSEETCPNDLPKEKRNRWLKTGKKAQLNQQLLATLPVFHWPVEYYGTPIDIHYRTPESVIISLTQRIQDIKFYLIDTESDKPTNKNPKSLPSLIQIQAISNKKSSVVILIEVQHLPNPNTSSFKLIKHLCDFIFSPDHMIMAWGEVTAELDTFRSFNLFHLSKITNTFNIQKHFANNWNNLHPHTLDCLKNSSSKSPSVISTDYLICHVNLDDLNEDIRESSKNDDHHLCICPENIRPYKTKKPLWSLQKALELTFNQALDKSMTMNMWSCGLDLALSTSKTFEDQCTRERLFLYAMNDLFVPTNLFFHLDHSSLFNHIPSILPNLNIIMEQPTPPLPLYFVLSDSHAKFVPSITTTSSHQIVVKAISGLKWLDEYNQQLSALSVIQTPNISSYLSSVKSIILRGNPPPLRKLIFLRKFDFSKKP